MRVSLAIILTVIIPNVMKSQNATATIENALSCSGEEVMVAVDVTDFIDVGAMTLYIGYDTSAAEFISLQNINQAVTGFLTSFAANGQIGIAYSNVIPFTITGGKLFDLQFHFTGDSTFLPFNPGTEIANSNLEIIPLTTYPGSISNGITITDQPDSVQVYPDSDVTFSVAATGAEIYQWQENSGNGWTDLQDNQTYSGANTETLNIYDVSLDYNGYTYRCLLTAGNCGDTTGTALLEVATAFPFCTLGQISSCPGQPILEPLYAGDLFDIVDFTFAVSFNGQYLEFTGLENINPVLNPGELTTEPMSDPNGIMIHWEDDIPFSMTSGKLFDLKFNYGSQDQTLAFEAGSEVVNSQSNPVNADFTDGQVHQYEIPAITQQPQSVTVTEGEEAVFTVAASGALTYQWLESQDSGATWLILSNSIPYYNVQTPQLTIDPTNLSMNNFLYACELGNEHCTTVTGAAVLEVDSLTLLEEEEGLHSRIVVLPNPFDGMVTFSLPKDFADVTLRIYGMNGTLVFTRQYTGQAPEMLNLSLPGLTGGLYFVQISGNRGRKTFTETRKIIRTD